MHITSTIMLCVIAYLLCSLNFALVAAKVFGFPDPRTAGSGNPGATNVLRLGGKKAAAFVLIGDIVKGIIPIIVAKVLGLTLFYQGIIALFAILGHIFPVYYGFKGGKGVATTIGVIVALSIKLGIAALLIWVIVAALFRYSSLASLIMAISLPAFSFALGLYPLLPSALLMMAIILIKHRANIRRLMLGQESKIGEKKSGA